MRDAPAIKLTSNFNAFETIGIITATLFCLGLILFMTYVWVYDLRDIGLFQRLMISFFPLLVVPLLLKVEVPKIKRIELDSESLTLINPLFGTKTKFFWTDLDGYKTMTHITRGGLVSELIIVKDGVEVFDISSFYYKNYKQISGFVKRSLRNVGQEDFKYWGYLKRRVLK